MVSAESGSFNGNSEGSQSTGYELDEPGFAEKSLYWQSRAICRDEDPDLFFPTGKTGPALVQERQAKAVCRRCPVIQECLAWALESGQDAGVWGGLSEDERRTLKTRNARAKAHLYGRK